MIGLILFLATLLPLLAAAALFGERGEKFVLRAAPLSAAPLFLLASPLGPEDGIWKLDQIFLGAMVELGEVSRVFMMTMALVWGATAIFATAARPGKKRGRRFFRFFYTAMAGNFLLLAAADMITFLVGFSMMSYAGYGLVLEKRSPEAYYAAKVYMILVVLAEVLLYAGALLAWSAAGDLGLEAVRERLSLERGETRLATGLLFAGFGVKAGMVPLHFWLPLAHPAAPAPASAVLSGAMIKAGLLGWMVFLPFGAPAMDQLGWWAVGAGLFAAFFGVILGLVQRKPKTILAYSSISQMGYMTLLFGIAAVEPETAPAVLTGLLLYVFHHSVAKGALFLSVRVARDVPRSKVRAFLEAGGMVLPALAMAGAPLTTGAVAKYLLKGIPGGAEALPAFLEPALILGAVGTTGLMARFLWVVWPREPRVAPLSKEALMSWLFLGSAAIWGPWVMPIPGFRSQARALLDLGAIWSAFWPLGLGVLIAVVILRRPPRWAESLGEALKPGDMVRPIHFGLSSAGWALSALSVGLKEKRKEAQVWMEKKERRLEEAVGVLKEWEERLRVQAWDWFWVVALGAAIGWALF